MIYLFPTLLIVLDIGAGCVYLYHGDLRHFGYWIAAACLTAFVTY